ncbi:MAG: S-layer homology domain-containing protein [Actinomycetota bacterium]|nr:S-layer homology domain-containing protein [Actinomycetota bacterium]
MRRYAIRAMFVPAVLAIVALTTPSVLADETGAIEGTVVGEVTGKPIADVLVVAYWYCPVQVALLNQGYRRTGADGRYLIDDLPERDGYYVKFSGERSGYQTEWYDDWHDVDNLMLHMLTSVEVTAGSVVDGIDAALTDESSSPPPPPPPPPSGTFSDDDGSVFEADIEWMAEEGITKGCNPPANDRFCPDGVVTRGQMAAFLVRALGLVADLDDPFTDDDASIFEADVERLAAAGITKGCNPPMNDRFCPDGVVTRGQMAAFLVRALGYAGVGAGDLFADDDDSIFANDIDRLGTAGVTKGCNPPTNDRFCPTGHVTRAQMAAFLHRALG